MAKNALGTTTRPCGIIPFGSDDESVIFQDSMTAIPGNGVIKGAPVFSAAGMNMLAGGWQFNLSAIANMGSLTASGQFSFEIDSACISDYAGDTPECIGAGGVNRSVAVTYVITWGSTASTTAPAWGRYYINNSEANQFQMTVNGGGAQLNVTTTNHGSGATKIITISWLGSIATAYVDGACYAEFSTGLIEANIFSYFSIGSNRGELVFDVGNYNIKNFIISNRPVMLAGHPMLSKVVGMGDSFIDGTGAAPSGAAGGYDHNMKYQFGAELISHGLNGRNFSYVAVGGTTIIAGIQSQIALAVAARPSIVICQGGTNDANAGTGYVEANFLAAYKTILTDLLATSTGIQKVFIGTVPALRANLTSFTEVKKTQAASVNAMIRSLPAWWDATNPTRIGDVVVYDLEAATGGVDGEDQMFAGTWWPGYSLYLANLHLSSKGRRVFGRLVGRTIYENLP